MQLDSLQEQINRSMSEMKTPFRSGTEIVLALTEELGEVAKEVALLEQIGSKTEWDKPANIANLAEEIIHTINLLLILANQYNINIAQEYIVYQRRASSVD